MPLGDHGALWDDLITRFRRFLYRPLATNQSLIAVVKRFLPSFSAQVAKLQSKNNPGATRLALGGLHLSVFCVQWWDGLVSP
jgi:hypothetical protein